VSAQAPARTDALLAIADDELVLGWRNSEWTGIAPFLEEDVAFSSIAQNEIGHARALYELVARELGTDADSVAFDRDPSEYRCSPLCQAQLVPDWAQTIARHYLYETADAIRIAALAQSENAELAGLAKKIAREEAYHQMHAQMWADRLRNEQRFREAIEAERAALPRGDRGAVAHGVVAATGGTSALACCGGTWRVRGMGPS
jgi:ring-1,2-phenylacetyl-CoA epoxidase subunit PaaC